MTFVLLFKLDINSISLLQILSLRKNDFYDIVSKNE